MAKITWRPGNMLYPLPAVLVTSKNAAGEADVCTVAWAGTVCSDPVMVSISLRPSRKTYENIRESGTFVVNVTTEELAHATDFCGVRSGREVDKFAAEKLETEPAEKIDCPMLAASPVNLECRVKEELALGSHTMFVGEVLAVHVEEKYLDEKGRFAFAACKPLAYCHGEYRAIGRKLGSFGYSVKKKRKKK
ncbi:MAG: flavin reductase family protein [bacterium]